MARANLLHKYADGFTLIELIVVMVIIGLMATIVVPILRRAGPGKERTEFVSYINAISLFAMQRAIEKGKVHKVIFNMTQRKLLLEMEAPKVLGKLPEFEPVKSAFLRTEFKWAPHLIFKNLYIDGKDMVRAFDKLTEAYFYITPDGLAQEVIINSIDMKDKRGGATKGKEFSLVLNPFTVQFKQYDTFQQP